MIQKVNINTKHIFHVYVLLDIQHMSYLQHKKRYFDHVTASEANTLYKCIYFAFLFWKIHATFYRLKKRIIKHWKIIKTTTWYIRTWQFFDFRLLKINEIEMTTTEWKICDIWMDLEVFKYCCECRLYVVNIWSQLA